MTEHLNRSTNDGGGWEEKHEESLGVELRRLWISEIRIHFKAEEEFLQKYGQKAGYSKDYISHVFEWHRTLEKLVWNGNPESIREFHRNLAAYIRFTQEAFQTQTEKIIESGGDYAADRHSQS